MDEIDYEIIKRLCKEARTPFKTIAEDLGVGIDAIIRRYEKLQKQRIILGSTIILSSEVCGIQGLCGLFIKIKSGSNVTYVEDQLRKISGLAEEFRMIGEYDLYVNMFYRDFGEVIALMDTIRQIKGIINIDSVLYREKAWSIPFLFNFELEVPVWAYPLRKR